MRRDPNIRHDPEALRRLEELDSLIVTGSGNPFHRSNETMDRLERARRSRELETPSPDWTCSNLKIPTLKGYLDDTRLGAAGFFGGRSSSRGKFLCKVDEEFFKFKGTCLNLNQASKMQAADELRRNIDAAYNSALRETQIYVLYCHYFLEHVVAVKKAADAYNTHKSHPAEYEAHQRFFERQSAGQQGDVGAQLANMGSHTDWNPRAHAVHRLWKTFTDVEQHCRQYRGPFINPRFPDTANELPEVRSPVGAGESRSWIKFMQDNSKEQWWLRANAGRG